MDSQDQPEQEIPHPHMHRIVFHAQQALTDPPPIKWLVEGLFPIPSVNLIVGQPGSKKTFLALDLAVSIALGQPWLGFPVTQAPALYVDEEAGLHPFWKRAHSALLGRGSPDTPFHFISPGRYDFRDYFETFELGGRVNDVGAKFVVIDALANVFGGSAETSLQPVQAVFRNLREQAVLRNLVILVIHHTNREGSFRGSSAIPAGVDLMLSIESAHSSPNIHLYPSKSRDVVPPPIHARAKFKDGRFWLEPTTDHELNHLSPSELAILKRIKEFGQLPAKDLADVDTSAPNTVNKHIHLLRMAGYIQRINEGSHGTPAILALTAKGEAHAGP